MFLAQKKVQYFKEKDCYSKKSLTFALSNYSYKKRKNYVRHCIKS